MKYEDSAILRLRNKATLNFSRWLDEIRKINDDGFFIYSSTPEFFKITVYFNDNGDYDFNFKAYGKTTIKILIQ